jgi:hypothetical protein
MIHHNPEPERTPSLSLSDLTISLPLLQHTQTQRYSALLWPLYPSRWYQDRVPRHHGSSSVSCLEDATGRQVWTCSVVLHCLCCNVLFTHTHTLTNHSTPHNPRLISLSLLSFSFPSLPLLSLPLLTLPLLLASAMPHRLTFSSCYSRLSSNNSSRCDIP